MMAKVSADRELSRREFLKTLSFFGSALFLGGQRFSPKPNLIFGAATKGSLLNEDPTPLPEQNPSMWTVTEKMFQFLIAHEVRRGDRGRKVVLMTYDDQGYRAWIEKILDVYQKAGAKASFFFTGDNLLLYSDQVKRIVSEGHVFGSHGLVHEPYTALRSDEIRAHLQEWLGMAQEIVPDYRVRYFRFPYGDRNDRVRRIVAEFGLQSVHWNIESGGLDKSTFDNVVNKITNGSIVLGHMNRYYDIEYAKGILEHLKREGFSMESVETGREAEDKFYQRRRSICLRDTWPRRVCIEE